MKRTLKNYRNYAIFSCLLASTSALAVDNIIPGELPNHVVNVTGDAVLYRDAPIISYKISDNTNPILDEAGKQKLGTLTISAAGTAGVLQKTCFKPDEWVLTDPSTTTKTLTLTKDGASMASDNHDEVCFNAGANSDYAWVLSTPAAGVVPGKYSITGIAYAYWY